MLNRFATYYLLACSGLFPFIAAVWSAGTETHRVRLKVSNGVSLRGLDRTAHGPERVIARTDGEYRVKERVSCGNNCTEWVLEESR